MRPVPVPIAELAPERVDVKVRHRVERPWMDDHPFRSEGHPKLSHPLKQFRAAKCLGLLNVRFRYEQEMLLSHFELGFECDNALVASNKLS